MDKDIFAEDDSGIVEINTACVVAVFLPDKETFKKPSNKSAS